VRSGAASSAAGIYRPTAEVRDRSSTGDDDTDRTVRLIVHRSLMMIRCVCTRAQVISEVVATFLLVFVTCGAASIYGADLKRVSQLGQSVVGGLIVTVMIYATGHISGAHMNPAVTLSFACFRHFPWIQVCARTVYHGSVPFSGCALALPFSRTFLSICSRFVSCSSGYRKEFVAPS
jgi:hypothetical protein